MAKKKQSHRRLLALLLPIISGAGLFFLEPLNFVRELEFMTVDWRFQARAKSDPPPSPEITLIAIGDQSLGEYGRWEEWTRDIHGDFARALAMQPPAVLAFDFFFSEKSRDPASDESFADGLSRHIAAITGMKIEPSQTEFVMNPVNLEGTQPLTKIEGDISQLLSGNSALRPIAIIDQSSYTGVVNCPPPPGIGEIRRDIPLVGVLGDQVYPSMVLQILMQKEWAAPDDVRVVVGESITVPKSEGGEWVIPIDEYGTMPINYRDTNRFEMIDYAATTEALETISKAGEGASSAWPETYPKLEGQIIIVGQSAEGLPDIGPTPYLSFDPLFRVQATALDNILQSDYLTEIPFLWVLLGWLLIVWLTLALLFNTNPFVEISVPLAVIVAYVFAAFALFSSQSIVLPLVLPVLGFIVIHGTIIAVRMISEEKAKRHIQSVFGTYVAQTIVKDIIDSGKMPELGGQKVDITVLFSDIQGFSTFSEQLSPEKLVDLMVEYLSEMTDIILDQSGTLDKYIGDAIDAMFGAPVPVEDHAYRSVVSAILMQEKQVELTERWKKRDDLPALVQTMRTRIGLNTGEAVVGNIGSVRRFNYTMMGDNVNLGARCESGAKSYGVYTMITGDTVAAAEKTNDDITYRLLDKIIVKGKTLPVEVYEVVGWTKDLTATELDCVSRYAEAFASYQDQKWDEAKTAFEKVSEIEFFQPDRDPGVITNPSLVMAARCKAMQKNPPEADWDGVYTMTTK